jgi:SAM-dependent methyltransferase
MPFQDEYFDIVFGDQVIGHIDSLLPALKEIHRVVKQGGIVAFTIANGLRPDGWYFNKTFSGTHQGYKQEGMFPWSLAGRLKSAGFRKEYFYGDMLFLFRNVNLIKSFFISAYRAPAGQSASSRTPVSSKKSLLRRVYHFLDNIMPAWLKVTIGIIARK